MHVRPVTAREVVALVDALTAELAQGGYGDDGTFGYSVERLEASGVHLLAAFVDSDSDSADGGGGEGRVPVAIGGLELGPDRTAELKRFYVVPAHRGSGAADAVVTALLDHARSHGVEVVRLETGDRQHAALRFYARHGFERVERFGPYVDSPTSVCLALRLG